ncbi:MAG: O-antigen ligase family protein [Candidatus Levybacteria bacterium]|nr:O-antigen ligase family protein [Candidatus Levybacteria bacterium]
MSLLYFLFAILFFLALLFTKSQSGFAAGVFAISLFIIAALFQELKGSKSLRLSILKSHTAGMLLIILVIFTLMFFFAGSPIERLNSLTYEGVKSDLIGFKKVTTPLPAQFGALDGTDSGKIRMIVWRGALDIFKNNPLIGTGVETFAFAYYKYRPIEHNLTSEWDYLYNKAHNEYLNYLATTGLVGLGAYLIMIITFIILILKRARTNSLLVNGLLAGYLSILVSNFFGFSVVTVNLYFFLIPAFAFILGGMISPQKTLSFPIGVKKIKITNYQLPITLLRWPIIFLIIVATFVGILTLLRFFLADKAYALGFNLDRTGQYQLAYPKLLEAVALRSGEPAFMDELSLNNAILSAALSFENEATLASQLKDTAIGTSDLVVEKHPNNIVFWKTRVRALYALSQTDEQYLPLALEAVKKASALAPTDAKVSYNLGLLYGQNGDTDRAVEVLEKTIKLKPDYYDAYYALGLFYHESALDEKGRTVKPELQKKAVSAMQYILDNFATDDAQALQALETWGELPKTQQ